MLVPKSRKQSHGSIKSVMSCVDRISLLVTCYGIITVGFASKGSRDRVATLCSVAKIPVHISGWSSQQMVIIHFGMKELPLQCLH